MYSRAGERDAAGAAAAVGSLLDSLALVGAIAAGSILGRETPAQSEGTRWLNVLKVLACYRLIRPGSEWRLHREWYRKSAMGICSEKTGR